MICVSIGRTRHQMMIAEYQALSDAGAEMIELRIDWLNRAPDLQRLLAGRRVPTVVTCRRPEDGGKWRGEEDARQTLLRSAVVAEVDYVDLERELAGKIRRYGKTKRIISYHNFTETPDDIEEIYASMCETDADVVKVVAMANTPVDAVRLLKLNMGAKVPTVAFAMGEFGVMSRLLCGKFGAPFTYATFSRERELAPGQLSFQDMRNLYGYDDVRADTKVFGVLGDPVSHSLSPLVHNTLMRKAGFNGVYLPLRVPQDQWVATLDAYDTLGFHGYSVTIPHKEAVLARGRPASAAVTEIGAANTLYRSADGAWNCDNTDCAAALDAIRSGLREGEPLDGKRALVLGSGGAARALAYGLVKAGALVTIAGRSAPRTKTLADSLNCRHTAWENRGAEGADLVVNCTPIGMHPDVDSSPMPTNWLHEGAMVFDTVYNPENTLLLKQARERGCRAVSGIEMFVRQAARQFELFTGQSVDLAELREIIRRGISPVRAV